MARDSTYFERLPSVRSDDFLPVISPWLHAGGVVLVATVGSVMALAATIQYTPVVEASGKLKHEGERYEVEAPVEGALSQIQIQPNQTVRQGEAIASLDPTGPASNKPILAPISGTVLDLKISHTHRVVKAGEAIATMTPTLAPLTLKAYVSSEEIGKVVPCHEPVMSDCQVGRAMVTVLSFPPPHHEPLLAIVRAISPDTLTPAESNDEVFEITLELPPAKTIPASMPLRAGMDVQVDILTQAETVLSLFQKASSDL